MKYPTLSLVTIHTIQKPIDLTLQYITDNAKAIDDQPEEAEIRRAIVTHCAAINIEHGEHSNVKRIMHEHLCTFK